MEKYEILKIFPEKEEKILDAVTREIPLTVYVNDKEIVTLLASPIDLTELAVGFLFTSGFIFSYGDVRSATEDKERWTVHLRLKDGDIGLHMVFKRLFTSGCGKGTLFYNAVDLMHRNRRREGITIDRGRVFHMMQDFQARSAGFKETGGVHSAALADNKDILAVREDIGRHNAVDKILGYALINKIELKDKIILSSGRVSSEIIFKIQKTDISAIVSRSAPTDQAIKHARSSGIALIGFARGQRMNVYSCTERIV
ncbi:MAG: formate dehydrogenase accessory sulfurtransferase FdhD [Candidatus Omnitrophica bacterium]|nr:formate dehydrogenase accessory sulfurtransferase FdhD [Candidatus Omnitrophota bacterium]